MGRWARIESPPEGANLLEEIKKAKEGGGPEIVGNRDLLFTSGRTWEHT